MSQGDLLEILLQYYLKEPMATLAIVVDYVKEIE
jgi:hypothetical protein